MSLRCLAVQVLKHIEAWRFPIICLPFLYEVGTGRCLAISYGVSWLVNFSKHRQLKICAKIGSIDSWVVDDFVHCFDLFNSCTRTWA